MQAKEEEREEGETAEMLPPAAGQRFVSPEGGQRAAVG